MIFINSFTSGGGLPAAVNIATAFDVVLYTGNGGGSRSLASIDLSGGGLVMLVNRTDGGAFDFFSSNGSTVYGANMDSTVTYAAPPVTFDASGFNLTSVTYNTNAKNYVAWVFKKIPRLLDIVPYTGDGSTGARSLAHALGILPGRVMVTRVDGTSNPTGQSVFDRHAPSTHAATTSSGFVTSSAFASTTPTSASFFVGGSGTIQNVNAVPYVAMLFAHDANADGVSQVCSWAGNSSSSGPTITLGWQPQCLHNKSYDGSSSWTVVDTTRTAGFTGSDHRAYTSIANPEDSGWGDAITLVANGFQVTAPSTEINGSGQNYSALAIKA